MRILHRAIFAGLACTAGISAVGACSSSNGGGTGPGANTPPKSGSVIVTSKKTALAPGYFAVAQFQDTTGVTGSAAACTTAQDGNCSVLTCQPNGRDGGTPADGGAIKYESAGTVDIQGGTKAIQLTAGAANSLYAPEVGPGALWSGGESISVHAAGDPNGVGTFTASVAAPPYVSLTAPKWRDGDGLTVDRSQDLTLNWKAAASPSGDVTAVFSVTAPTEVFGGTVRGGKTIVATCKYPAAAQTGTIPKTVLGLLNPNAVGTFAVAVYASSVQNAGDWQITSELISEGDREGGNVASTALFKVP